MNSTRARERGPVYTEPAMAIAAFAAFCIVVLTVAPLLLGPDGEAYRASIVAITDGHFLSLSASQAHALVTQLYRCPRSATACLSHGPVTVLGRALEQWVELPDGRWISEKNPGYPFLAAPFQALGLIRLAPLCYAGLGCLGLYSGGRRWLGSPGGAVAVGLFCSCDLVMLFAWQDYWSALTDASLIAAGTGTLLWAALADDVTDRRRIGLGLLGFLAIEAAVLARYTNVVVLGCAVVTVIALRRLQPGTLPRAALRYWLGSAALLAAGVAAFDGLVYGAPLDTGYRPGTIVFSLGAVGPNLRYMPAHLIAAMPVLLLALAALILIIVRRVRLGRDDTGQGSAARRDFAIALILAAPWLTLWALYATYTWTAQPGIGTWQSARFYLPAIGPIALLGSWLLVRAPQLTRWPGRTWRSAVRAAVVIVALFALATWTFHDQASPATPSPPPGRCNIGQPHCPATPPQAASLTGSYAAGRTAS
jgi:hypothetical protein